MQTVVQNLAPDCDCIHITVGPNNDVVISVSRNESGEVEVSITNNVTSVDETYVLGHKFSTSKFYELVAKEREGNPRLRMGQAMWNVATRLWPKSVEELRGSELDPFYDDNRIEGFVGWLSAR